MLNRPIIISILGPTASGKTGFALELAERIQGEIICADSATVYRGFDIGSSKPSTQDRERIPHHLVDILDPHAPFSAFDFAQKASAAIEDILSRGKTPLIVGGTYFYLRALTQGMHSVPSVPDETIEKIEARYALDEGLDTLKMHADLKSKDPASAERIHPNDRYRLVRSLALLDCGIAQLSDLVPEPNPKHSSYLWMKYALTLTRQKLTQNISRRVERMLHDGIIDETRKLRLQFPEARALSSIGYKECCGFLDQKLTEKQLRTEIMDKTRQLAKRQITWLRGDSELRIIDTRDLERVVKDIENLRVALSEG